MSAEETLIETRKQKHQELNGGIYPLSGFAPYIKGVLDFMTSNPQPVSLDPTQLTNEIKIHGRISNFRKSGGISFIKLTDGTGSMQCIASKAVLADYDRLHLLDLGDIIEVGGKMCLSKTQEKSVLILGWNVVTKSHRPPPEKFAGITDTELKYRKRYLDLMSSEESRAVFTTRSFVLRAIRKFMENNGFMEVETSTLNSVNSGANAKPFTTHHNALETDLFLRIAPELYLKRLLVGGYEKVFEIGRNYRNEGISTRHNPEFTMMEFYEAYGRFHQLIQYADSLFSFIDSYLQEHMKHNFAYSYYLAWKEQRTFTFQDAQVVTMQQAVINGLNRAGMSMQGEEQKPLFLNELDKQERQSKIDLKTLAFELSKVKTHGERTAIYFEYVAEPFLTEDYRTTVDDKSYSVPVFVTEYPVEICPLARPSNHNSMVCDRYELFVDGRELCNAFQELNDPDEQARKFKEQLVTNNKDAMDYDADYVEALEYGMPPAIGFGMGIDRLVMLLTNAASIKDVILFPTLKPIKVDNA
jgi:lysyl-tRNA synthetase class 2